MLAACPRCSGQARPELGVTGPVHCPIQHRPFWRLEPALFAYQPRFVPGVVTFDLQNRPYIRSEGTVQTLGDDGNWVRIDFTRAIRAKYPDWDGKFATGPFAEEHVVFDEAGDAYMIVNTTRSSIGRVLLLHSTDLCQSWRAHVIGSGHARLERPDGHNEFRHPPPVLIYPAGSSGLLLLVLPEKNHDGSLDVSTVKEVSRDSYLVPNHSGGGNSLCSQGDLVHIVWPGRTDSAGQESKGTPEYAATYDRGTGALTEPTFLGFGGTGRPNPHNLPAIAADSNGYLHVVMGAHHDPFRYTRSLSPGSVTDGWTEPVEFGAPKPSPNEGSYTYAGWICDAEDTLHCVARWAGAGYRFRLVYLRKRQGGPWEDQQYLVVPFAGNYSVYYHKLNMDRRGRLFVNYHYTRAARFADEIAAHAKKWPTQDASVRFIRKDPCILTSDDGGDSWRLAVTADLMPTATAPPRTASRPNTASTEPKEQKTISAKTLLQLGGGFGPLDVAGGTACVGVGNSLVLLDVSSPGRINVLAQAAPLGDRIMDVHVRPPYVYVAAWRDGFAVYDVSDPSRPRLLDHDRETEARGFEVVDNLVYLTAAKGGLRVIDVSEPEHIREVGRFRGAEAYDVAIADHVAYLALGHGGLKTVHVADPTSPRQIAHVFRPSDYADRVNTAWGLTRHQDRLYVSPGPGEVCLRIYDISTPTDPKELGRLARPWGWGRKTAAGGSLLYFAGLDGLHVLDVSDPSQPRVIADTDISAVGVAANGNRLYATGGASGITVLDVSDPQQPKPMGSYEYPRLPFGIAVDGDRAYVADWDTGLHVFDVSDAGLPKAMGTYRKERWALGVSARGSYAYVAAGKTGLVVLDVSDPAHIREVGSLETATGVRDVALHGHHAFIAEADTGIRVLDISDPTKPRPLASFDTPRQALGVATADGRLYIAEAQMLKGGVRICEIADTGRLSEIGYWECDTDVWGVFASDNRVYAAMAADGLHLLDVATPAGPSDLGRINLSAAAVWGAARARDFLYAACGKDGLSVVSLSPAG